MPRHGPQSPELIEKRRRAVIASFARRRAAGLTGRRLPEDESYEPDGARRVPLTRGLVAVVDAADYALVSGYSWYAKPAGRTHYAERDRFGAGARSLHRMLIDAPAGMEIDHIDGNGLNNRRSNLRICRRKENLWNRGALGDRRFKGVFRAKQGRPWRAAIMVHGKRIDLGRFDTPEQAALAVDTAAKQYHGEFARLNFPNDHSLPPSANDYGGEAEQCRDTRSTSV